MPDGTAVFTHIAAALGVPRSDVEFMDARLSGPDLSLNAPLGDSESSVGVERMAMLIDDKPRPDEAVGLALDTDRRTAWLNEALTALSERERRIVRERRLAEEAATLEALGDRLGISKERVRQIESRAMEKLRAALDQTPHGKCRGNYDLRRGALRGAWLGPVALLFPEIPRKPVFPKTFARFRCLPPENSAKWRRSGLSYGGESEIGRGSAPGSAAKARRIWGTAGFNPGPVRWPAA